jgi:arylsulfatase A-like enzyme
MADDLGYRELGSYAQEKIRTPNIDRLAREGVRFTQAYSGSAVCAPSRCILLTGKHAGHAAIRNNKEVGGWGPEEPEGQMALPDGEITIAEALQDAGYTTGVFGKWGLGGPGSEGHPLNQGFDHFYGYLCQRVAHNYYPTHLWRNHDVDVLHGNDYFKAHQRIDAPLDSEADYARYAGNDYAPEAIAEEMLGFIRKSKDEPFFVYYASIIPHVALQAPRRFIDMYPAEWDQSHYLGDKGYLPTPRPRATYAAMITYLDDVVGRIRAELEAQGLAEDTLIIFTSDNGTSFAGGVDMAFFGSLEGLRGRKGDLFEGGIRVPLVAWMPRRIEGGRTSDMPVAAWDLFPTIANFAGVDPLPRTDGISLRPMLDQSGPQSRHGWLYWEFPGYGAQQAVRMGKYKALRRNMRQGDAPIQIFDLESDPGERRDIAAHHPDLRERFERIMRDDRTPSPDFPMPILDR